MHLHALGEDRREALVNSSGLYIGRHIFVLSFLYSPLVRTYPISWKRERVPVFAYQSEKKSRKVRNHTALGTGELRREMFFFFWFSCLVCFVFDFLTLHINLVILSVYLYGWHRIASALGRRKEYDEEDGR
ncbi:hypothetical protein M426DRAFT_167023 [Hypoxylon sp. CI-4A]|nr:hypothetical protein M426DRAFT_167023 [Hypoxylon sp. CI-4A]